MTRGRVAHLDLVGGVAGDMLMAALFDAGADLDAVLGGLGGLGLVDRGPTLETVTRGGIRALHLAGTPATGQAPRTLAEILAILTRADLPEPIAERATAVFRRLVDAEARAHGQPPDAVRLHEAGDDDAIFDVVGVLLALRSLGIEMVTSSPVPLGGGRGPSGMSWPGPAVLELLRGLPTIGPPPDGEATTPTGAALVASLATAFGGPPPMTLVATGYGAGSRDTPDRPNLVRVLVGEASEAAGSGAASAEAVWGLAGPWQIERDLRVVAANLDDLSPQLVADAATALFAAGALDVWQTSIQMKRGRLAVTLSALVTAEALDAARTAFFRTTTTLGVRDHTVDRAVLRRGFGSIEIRGASIRFKRGWLGDEVATVMPEHADLERLSEATDIPVRRLWTETMAAIEAARPNARDEEIDPPNEA